MHLKSAKPDSIFKRTYATIFDVVVLPGADIVLVGAWNHQVRLWKVGEPATVELGTHDGEVSAVAFLDGGARAVSASFDETLRVWDVAERRCLDVLGEPRVSGLPRRTRPFGNARRLVVQAWGLGCAGG